MPQTLHKLKAGQTYAVTPTTECVISTSDGTVILTAQAGTQACFVAPTELIYASDPACLITETFKGASVAVAGGGGSTICVDAEFSPLSGNAQSGVAVKQAIVSVDTYVSDYGVLDTALDLSAYSIDTNGRVAPTDEIWFELGADAVQITWPQDWIWLEGAAPDLSAQTAYRIAVRQESEQRTIANVAYSYDIPTE